MKNSSIYTEEIVNLLINDASLIKDIDDVTLDGILEKSKGFPIKFPINTVRCETLKNTVSKTILEVNINSTYPLIHEDILGLCANFLLKKIQSGSSIEKSFYKNFSVLGLIQRLLEKRAVTFMKAADYYTLLDGTKGVGNWESVGTEAETPPLTLENCLSYDEMKISAFLSVSSYTYFINSGSRQNRGKMENSREKIESRGIIVGLIGPRFPRPGVMEHADTVFSQRDLTTIPAFINDFYKVPQTNGLMRSRLSRCVQIKKGLFFDNAVYEKRLAYTFDTFLIEANHRAKMNSCSAFIYMVGIGLGIWRTSPHQDEIFLKVFIERLENLATILHNISDLRFGYFKSTECKYKDGDQLSVMNHPNGGIKIHFSNHDPYLKLDGENEGKLLVAGYAWDSNALPGNEFWSGKLHTSGDSAAASSTQISELHNVHINPKCSASNLKIATGNGCIVTYKEFLNNLLKKK